MLCFRIYNLKIKAKLQFNRILFKLNFYLMLNGFLPNECLLSCFCKSFLISNKLNLYFSRTLHTNVVNIYINFNLPTNYYCKSFYTNQLNCNFSTERAITARLVQELNEFGLRIYSCCANCANWVLSWHSPHSVTHTLTQSNYEGKNSERNT